MASNVLALGRKVLNSHALHQSVTSGQASPPTRCGCGSNSREHGPAAIQTQLKPGCVCCVTLSSVLNISELQADLHG